MKILAIEKELPNKTAQDFEPFLKSEAQNVWQLYKNGIIRELFFRQDRKEAVLILECTDVMEAQNILQTLPLVKEKLITFDIIPLGTYTGFERLWIKKNPVDNMV